MTKKCLKCGKTLPIESFTRTKKKYANGESVRNLDCKTCMYAHLRTGRTPGLLHLNAIRHKCKQKGIPFDLDLDDISIPDRCPILGIKLNITWGGHGRGPAENSPSVDRVVPELGYVKGNVHVISHRANRLKSDATIENVRALLAYMERHQPNQAAR